MKIIFFPNGWFLSHVCRPIEIAKLMREEGHEVIFAGQHRHPRSKLPLCEREGFRTIPCLEFDGPFLLDYYLEHGPLAALLEMRNMHKFAPLDRILDAQVEVIQREKPDLVAGDGTASLGIAAHITGTPFSAIMNAYWLHFYRPLSAYGLMIRLWNVFHLSRLRRRVFRKYECQPVNAMDLFFSSRIISPGLEELDGYARAYPEWESVGPIWGRVPCDRPAWLDEIDDGVTNIYITMGSTGALDDFLLRVYDALGKTPFRFLVTTAKQVSEATIEMAPDNFLFADYAPGEQVLAKSSALIFHGGNGTMYQALAAGVPMIGIPQHLEQVLNIRKCEEFGFGMRLRQRGLNGEKLARALDELLNNPSYRTAAEGFAKRIDAAPGVERAARLMLEEGERGEAPRVKPGYGR